MYFRPRCTLIVDPNHQNHYLLDDWLGIRKYQRHSPLVEVKVAESWRVSLILNEWTVVTNSHQTVGILLKRVGEAQASEEEETATELEESATLPAGKKWTIFMPRQMVFLCGEQKIKKV